MTMVSLVNGFVPEKGTVTRVGRPPGQSEALQTVDFDWSSADVSLAAEFYTAKRRGQLCNVQYLRIPHGPMMWI